MKNIANIAAKSLSGIAKMTVSTTASVGWLHNPKVPTELLKK